MTNLKPDVVIIDRKSKKVDIFEKTVPGEHRIESSHNLKTEKYSHFLSDITRYQPSLTAFEVGAQTGYLTKENKKAIGTLHKYCQKNIKLKTLQTTSLLSQFSVHTIYLIAEISDYFSAPFANQ